MELARLRCGPRAARAEGLLLSLSTLLVVFCVFAAVPFSGRACLFLEGLSPSCHLDSFGPERSELFLSFGPKPLAQSFSYFLLCFYMLFARALSFGETFGPGRSRLFWGFGPKPLAQNLAAFFAVFLQVFCSVLGFWARGQGGAVILRRTSLASPPCSDIGFWKSKGRESRIPWKHQKSQICDVQTNIIRFRV